MSSTEEPRLTWFELEVCPFQLRLAIVPGHDMLFGFRSDDGKVRSIQLPYRGNEQRAMSLLESLHWLIVANGILDAPEVTPDASFLSRAMRVESVHIRIAYSDGRKWASMYLPAEVPANLQALIEQARYLATQAFEQPAQAAHAQGS